MAVLAHLHDEHAGAAALGSLERIDATGQGGEAFVAGVAVHVHPFDGADLGGVAAEHLFHGIAHLADGGPGASGIDAEGEQVGIAGSASGDRGKGRLHDLVIALGADLGELGDLLGEHRGVVDVEHVDELGVGDLVLVDADDDLLALIDAGLAASSGLFDAELGHAGLDGLGHAAQLLDLIDEGLGLVDQLVGERLDVVAATERIDDVGDAGLLLDHQLGVAGDAGRGVGGQPEGLVERVGVERLGAAQHRRHGLDGGADHVVVRIHGGERHPGGLAVGAQHQRLLVLGLELAHGAVPQDASGSQLGDLHEEVHADCEKKLRRPANLSTSRPCAMAARTYSLPSAMVKASSCSAVAPASCMWYPEMLIEFHLGM